jgi:type VI secretion system secreted protein Hcp
LGVGFYVSIVGGKQGKFKGESAKGGRANAIEGLAFHYEVATPRDTATGMATGKRQHGAVSLVKRWDAASPQLYQAALQNEILSSVLFEFLRVNAEGNEEVFESIKLTNAAVTSFKQHVQSDQAQTQELEEITFTFNAIQFEASKTLVADSWKSNQVVAVSVGEAAAAAPAGAAAIEQKVTRAAGAVLGEPIRVSAPDSVLLEQPLAPVTLNRLRR